MYKIKIEKTFIKEMPVSKSYEQIGLNEDGDSTYGYVDKPPYFKEVTETIFEQSVESINLKKVIASINDCDLIVKKRKT